MRLDLPTVDDLRAEIKAANMDVVCDERGCRMVKREKSEERQETEGAYYNTVIQDGWIPVSEQALQEAGLKDGDQVEYWVTHGQIILRKRGLLRTL